MRDALSLARELAAVRTRAFRETGASRRHLAALVRDARELVAHVDQLLATTPRGCLPACGEPRKLHVEGCPYFNTWLPVEREGESTNAAE